MHEGSNEQPGNEQPGTGQPGGEQSRVRVGQSRALEEVSLPPQRVGRRRRRAENGWRPWTRDLVISVMVSVFIILFLYQPVRVEGTSMLPQLQDQDRLFINKFAYHIGEIHRGDVVVFRYPRDQTKSYIKRVIALPGDDLRIDHGVVYVNGKQLKES